MAKSPVQIVLNSTDFISVWERQGGGENKDFYEGKDVEFAAHQSKLSKQLSVLEDKQFANKYSDVTYAKVILKQSGIAKSHRPTNALFNHNTAPVIGAGDLGEMFVELLPGSIQSISQKINSAEKDTKYKEKATGEKAKQVANPSTVRSEVGAIEGSLILPQTNEIFLSMQELNGLPILKQAARISLNYLKHLPRHRILTTFLLQNENYSTVSHKGCWTLV